MTRQEKLSYIGQMKLEAYATKIIIPCPHNVYDANQINTFELISQLGWKILNQSTGKQFGAFNLKTYIYDNMVPQLTNTTDKNFFSDCKTLILNKEILSPCRLESYDFSLSSIDLWIFEENISFFVLNIDVDVERYSIDELSNLHSKIRQFKFLNLEFSGDKIIFTSSGYQESYSVIDYLIGLTKNKNIKSFLNIDKEIYKSKNNLDVIYNSTTNAKLLLGMQTKSVCYDDGSEIEPYEENNLGYLSTKELSILSEVTYYLASCSSLNPTKDFTPDDGYIYSCKETGGFGVWKYASGLVVHDSAAFIGLGNDGGRIVSNVNNSFYFIYMLNLYIYFQIRFIEHELIDSKFESYNSSYLYTKLQKLKNQFVVDDIAVKFQENEVHKSFSTVLGNSKLITEVTENLKTTQEVSQQNIKMYLAFAIFIFVNLFEDTIKENIAQHVILIALVVIPLGVIAYFKRHHIRKKFKI